MEGAQPCILPRKKMKQGRRKRKNSCLTIMICLLTESLQVGEENIWPLITLALLG